MPAFASAIDPLQTPPIAMPERSHSRSRANIFSSSNSPALIPAQTNRTSASISPVIEPVGRIVTSLLAVTGSPSTEYVFHWYRFSPLCRFAALSGSTQDVNAIIENLGSNRNARRCVSFTGSLPNIVTPLWTGPRSGVGGAARFRYYSTPASGVPVRAACGRRVSPAVERRTCGVVPKAWRT